MQIGLTLGYWGRSMPDGLAELAAAAERAGFDAAWTGESWGSDAFSPLVLIAAATERIRLGTGVVQIAARTPTATAMHAVTLDHISGGRAILGLGVSGPQVVEGWYGRPSVRPLARTREYVEILRRVFRREDRLVFAGEHFQHPYAGEGAEGLGKPLKIMTHPLRSIPIWIGAEGPRNVAQTVEIADGWLPLYYSPLRPEVYAEALAGAASGFEIAVHTTLRVCDLDAIDDALWPVRASLGFYIGGMGAEGQNYHTKLMARMGYEEGRPERAAPLLGGPSRRGHCGRADSLRRRDLPRGTRGAHPRAPAGMGGVAGDHVERGRPHRAGVPHGRRASEGLTGRGSAWTRWAAGWS